jgi:hypothetical protein
MECLKNYIQIEGCDAPDYIIEGLPAEPSGLYINKDLPISLQEIDAFADGEQFTFLTVWDEVQNRGIKKFINRVRAGYLELFRICFIDEAWFCENKEHLKYALLYFLGVELMIEKIYTIRINRFTRSFDKVRAQEMRDEFQAEYINYLKSGLLEIGHSTNSNQGGDIYSLVEVMP